jgi:hypothetical protein
MSKGPSIEVEILILILLILIKEQILSTHIEQKDQLCKDTKSTIFDGFSKIKWLWLSTSFLYHMKKIKVQKSQRGKIGELPKLNVDVPVFNTSARHVPTSHKSLADTHWRACLIASTTTDGFCI